MDPFNTRSVSFAEPIEMLYACHGKVRRFCEQLDKLPAYLQQHGCNQAVLQAVAQIRQYFNQAAPLHHQDEEDDFFPLLQQNAPQAQADIQELQQQHQQLHSLWHTLDKQLAQLATEQQAPETELIQQFIQAYQRHLAIEEPLFELGKQTIPTAALTQIGTRMAARRQPASS